MKVIILADAYFENSEYQINNFVKYYLKHGHKVVVICSIIDNLFDYYNDNYNNQINESIIINENLKIIRKKYQINILFKIRRFANIYNILFDEKPDLIFLQDIHFNLNDAVCYKVNLDNRCRIIMNFHTDFSNSAKNIFSKLILHKLIRGTYLKLYINNIDKIFPVVEKSKYFLKKMYNIKDDKLELLPIGVDIDLFNDYKVNSKIIEIKKQLNIPQNSIVIFTGGKMSPVKQSNIVLESVNLLNNKNVYLVIAGIIESDNKEFKEKFYKYVSDNKNILFLGWKDQSDLFSIMSICDIAIFPASQSVLWQYSIGMGLALIAGKYCTIQNGKTFEQDLEYLNLFNNVKILNLNMPYVKQIVEILNDLINDPKKLEFMKSGANKTSETFLNFNKIINKTFN